MADLFLFLCSNLLFLINMFGLERRKMRKLEIELRENLEEEEVTGKDLRDNVDNYEKMIIHIKQWGIKKLSHKTLLWKCILDLTQNNEREGNPNANINDKHGEKENQCDDYNQKNAECD